MIKNEYKNLLLCIIHKYLPESKVYLFGSQATGKATDSSDIDIALDSGKAIDYTIILSILAEIDETIIPMKVDVVDLHGVQESFRQVIMNEGVLWKN